MAENYKILYCAQLEKSSKIIEKLILNSHLFSSMFWLKNENVPEFIPSWSQIKHYETRKK